MLVCSRVDLNHLENITLLLGTHWIRISHMESKDFALLPIFAFDDDYVPLSPIPTPVFEDKTKKKSRIIKHINQNNNNNNNDQHLTDISQIKKDSVHPAESSDIPSSRTSSITSSQFPISPPTTTPMPSTTVSDKSMKESKMNNGRTSPEVQILDITDLNDPGVRVVSKFSFKDIDNKFQINIIGK